MEVRRAYRSAEGLKATKPAFVLDSLSMQSRIMPYNGLQDFNLKTYFSNKRRRKLLVKVGLISAQGELVPGAGLDKAFTSLRKYSIAGQSGERRFLPPEPEKSVYARRSQSVKLGKMRQKTGKKPVTHQELQSIFEKYRPKGESPSLP
jgi:hypothetical protein